jgi:hypothetical protein
MKNKNLPDFELDNSNTEVKIICDCPRCREIAFYELRDKISEDGRKYIRLASIAMG